MDLKDAEGRWKAAYDRVVKGHTDWDQFKQWLADPDTSNTIVMGFSGFAGVGPTGENVRDYVQPPPRAERAWGAPLKPLAHEGPSYPGNRPAGESPPRGAPPECVPPRLPKAAMDAGRPAGRIVGEGVAPGKVGEYTTKIKWGIHDIDARPHGSGYWGKRIPQNDARVDAFELKINPNNESYYLPHPEGGFVQFENLSATALQDGKLIIKPKSIYHVDDLPAFAKNKVIAEAQRQVAAGKKAGLPVEWLVSDQKAVTQLDKLFKSEGIPISVKHFPE